MALIIRHLRNHVARRCELGDLALLLLLLFAAPAVAAPVDFKAGGDVAARDFGAAGDGVTLDTASLQAAIDFCSSHGGGRVVLTPGTYLSGSIYLKDGVTLHIEEGATLLGSLNPWDYIRDPYCKWTAFIFAVKQMDIGITGSGVIDCRGREVAFQMVQFIHSGLVEDTLGNDRPNETNRPENIHFRECQNITISGITLKNPASWNQQYDQCRGLLIEDVTVDANSYWNNDGLDVVDCSDVIVRRCNIDSADDAYCFKSHSVNGVSENILVEDCVGRSGANGVKFGTMTLGKFRHFTFRNLTIKDTYRSAITIACVDGGQVEDIVVDGLKSYHTGNPIFIRTGARRDFKMEPCLKDIVIRNVYAEVPYEKPDGGYSYEGPVEDLPRNVSPSSIVGIPGLRMQNIRLENVELVYPGKADRSYAFRGLAPDQLAAIPEMEKNYPEFSMFKELPAWGLYLRHADGVALENVTFRVDGEDYRPAVVADDITALTFKGLHIFREGAEVKEAPFLNNVLKKKPKAPRQNSPAFVPAPAPAAAAVPAAPAEPVALGVAPALASVDKNLPLAPADRMFRASLFGIKSDGVTDNTASFQRAIDWIAAHGGGTLDVSVGRYMTGAVQLKSGVNVYLREGAIIVGNSNIYAYEGAPALFWADGASDINVYGLGIIEGRHADLSASLAAQKASGHLRGLHLLPEIVSFRNCSNCLVSTPDPAFVGSEGVRLVPDRISTAWPRL